VIKGKRKLLLDQMGSALVNRPHRMKQEKIMAHTWADGSEEQGPREQRQDEVAAENYRAGGICRRKGNDSRDMGTRDLVHQTRPN
jgi:hypothetical protein